MEKRRLILMVCGLLLVTAVAMFPSLSNGYTNWDDYHLLLNNDDVANTDIGNAFTSYYVGTYIPLTVISFMLDYHVWNLDPFYSHFANYLLHAINALLVFWLITKLSGRPAVGLLTALLFSLHPLRVESVAWITGRKDVLCGLFFLGSLLSYMYFRERGRRALYAAALVMFLLSLFSKGLAVTLPIVLLLCDYVSGRRLDKKLIMEKVPFFAAAAFFALLAFLAQGTGEGWGPEHAKLSPNNLLVGCYTLVFYLGKTIAPLNLCALYPHPVNIATPFTVEFWASAAIVLLTAALLFRSRRYTSKLLFGAGFFVVTLIPVLQFFPVGGQAIAADRYTYIPAIGLAYAAAELVIYAFGRLRLNGRRLLIAAVAILLIGYSILSWQRCAIWKNSMTLWTDVIDRYPSVAMAWFNRGEAYGSRGKTELAMSDYTIAIGLDHYESLNNRGLLYHVMGEYDAALADFNTAIGRKEDFADAWFNRGNTKLAMLEYDLAVADYDKAIELDPVHTGARLNRGALYSGLEEYEKAIADFTRVLELNPNDQMALRNRAVCHLKSGRADLAEQDLRRMQAMGLRPVTSR